MKFEKGNIMKIEEIKSDEEHKDTIIKYWFPCPKSTIVFLFFLNLFYRFMVVFHNKIEYL